MNAISVAIGAVGGPVAAAKICNIRRQAIDKWLARKALPRTEYTGETDYARRLADASNGKFTAVWLLAEASPKKPSQPKKAVAAQAEEAGERRAAHDLAERRGRRETDPTGAELKALHDCAEQALAVAGRLVG